jgi:hypothetical protein
VEEGHIMAVMGIDCGYVCLFTTLPWRSSSISHREAGGANLRLRKGSKCDERSQSTRPLQMAVLILSERSCAIIGLGKRESGLNPFPYKHTNGTGFELFTDCATGQQGKVFA